VRESYIVSEDKGSAIPLRNEGKTMHPSNSEIFEKLKMATMRRCEERIATAGKGSGFGVDGPVPQFGVTSLLRSRHGL